MRRLTAMSVCGLVVLGGCGSARSASVHAGSTVIVTIPAVAGKRTLTPIQPPASVTRAGGRTLAEFRLGRSVATQSGCLACHRIGEQGNGGPGRDLTELALRLPRRAIEVVLIRPISPMPSYRHLPRSRFKALVTFLALLRG